MTNRKDYPRPEELAADHDMPPPGTQREMRNKPRTDMGGYRGSGKLEGKVALITGGDSGIGRAVAVAFALEGARVVVAFNVNEADGADVAALIEAQGGEALAVRADVTRPEDRARLVAATVERFGGLDVLVNNAAYFEGSAPFGEITAEDLQKTYETNVFAYVLLAQEALPHIETAQGAIINTSSSTSILGKKGALTYSSSKGAVNLLTKTMAMELGPRGIRVNAVLPGPFWTPAIATSDRATVAKFGGFTTLGRPGQPEEIAPVYVLLAADGNFISGALYEVTGGFEGVDD